MKFESLDLTKAIKNYIYYLQQDKLGVVANLHSKVADQSQEAAGEEECLFLNDLHNIFVDFGK